MYQRLGLKLGELAPSIDYTSMPRAVESIDNRSGNVDILLSMLRRINAEVALDIEDAEITGSVRGSRSPDSFAGSKIIALFVSEFLRLDAVSKDCYKASRRSGEPDLNLKRIAKIEYPSARPPIELQVKQLFSNESATVLSSYEAKDNPLGLDLSSPPSSTAPSPDNSEVTRHVQLRLPRG